MGSFWVRFDPLKKSENITTYALIGFYIKFKLGSFRKKHFFGDLQGGMDGKVVPGGAGAGLGLGPDGLKNLAFDLSWSKNLGGGRRGAGAHR